VWGRRAVESSSGNESIDCAEESKKIDIFPVAVDKCSASPMENPISITSQDGDSVTFTVAQDMFGCDERSWIATDFINQDDNIVCHKESNLKCGHVSTYTTSCEDGVAVIDLFASANILHQTDGAVVSIPDACDATAGDAKHACHLRYHIQCVPSMCSDKQESSMSRRLGSSMR
jgi:hypothetical protein